MNYKAVFFDFDYTLGDATEAIYGGFCYAFQVLGYPKPKLDDVRHTVGYMLSDAFSLLTGNSDPATVEKFRELFRTHGGEVQADQTVMFPGAVDLLTALHEGGVRVGVVSSKRSVSLLNTLDKKGIRGLFDYVVGGELVCAPKPDPEGLNAGMAAVGAAAGDTLYCGDTVIDAETAKRAGVDFAAVLNGTTGAAAFEVWPSVHVAPDLIELRGWLGI